MEPGQPVHRLGRLPPHRSGAGGGPGRRAGHGRGRPATRRAPHVAADPGDRDRRSRPRRAGSALDPGSALLAAQRAALRRAHRPRQEGHRRPLRRRPGAHLAALLRRAPATARAGLGVRLATRRPLRRPGPRRGAGHRVPQGRGRPDAALLVRRHRGRPAGRPAGAGGRPRQLAASPGHASRRDQRGRHPRRSTCPPGCRCSTSWTTELRPLDARHPLERVLGDPEAARAKAAAVARQAG